MRRPGQDEQLSRRCGEGPEGDDEDEHRQQHHTGDEAAANAVAHGQSPGGNGLVRLRCSTDGACVVVAISDEGAGFDPQDVDMHSPPNWTSQGGRGLFLVQELMDEVHIDGSPGGTVIEMKRHVELPRPAVPPIPDA